MRNYTIFSKLFLTHTAIGLVSLFSLSIIFYFLFQNALIQLTINQLSSINALKKNHIDQYFNETQKNIEFQFDHRNSIGRPMADVKKELETMQQLYHFESMVVVDDQYQKFLSTSSDSLLTNIIAAFGQTHSEPLDKFIIWDATAMMRSPNTVIVYAMPFRVDAKTISGFVFIHDDFGKVQRILQETTGMGNTGESYLVGNDFRMRSASRLIPHLPPASIEVNTVASKNVFKGIYQGGIILDYRQVKVLSYYRKIGSPSLHWALVSEIDFEEAVKPMIHWRNYIVLVTLLLLIVIIGITYFISNAISLPILGLKNTIVELSRGIIPPNKIIHSNTSEVGQIAQAMGEWIEGIKRTTEFANEIGAGKFNTPFITLSDQDTLGFALIRMRDKLKRLSEEQLRLVREKAAALLEGQENERKRIVQELHDGVGQLLTGVRLRVQMLEQEEKLKREILVLIDETVAEVKRISYQVMPNAIVDFGLEAALNGLCDHVRKLIPMTIDFDFVKETDRPLRFEISIAVFRIVQEGFNNIMKHSKATQVELYMLYSEEQLYFIVKDNGRGFDESATGTSQGFGLHSMRERAKLLNGNLEIHSTPGQGTVIEVTIPIDQSGNG
jgi:two-component system, NarL family, sensor kinase